MEAYVAVSIVSALVFAGVYLVVKYPAIQSYLPQAQRFMAAVRITADYWGFRKAYSDAVELGIRYLALLETLKVVEGEDLRDARLRVGNFITLLYITAYPGELGVEKARRAATASYMALLEHEEILETIRGLQNHEDLDVRKATLIAIDVLGELFDREDELSREYFQHIVYGLNQCLVKFKKSGQEPDNMRDIYGILWRMYQLTKAYNASLGSQGLTKEEFYGKISAILTAMSNILAGE